jgi:alpha-galactosidase
MRLPIVPLVALMLSPAALAAGPAPVKVFILAGQSNMEGFGHPRTLPRLAGLPGGKELLAKIGTPDGKGGGKWTVRDDVFISFRGGETAGKLSVGFGAGPDRLGPELAFGIAMGDLFEEPVLLIKAAWGGKDIQFDFRPPGAGPFPYPIDPKALEERGGVKAVGECYRHMVSDVKDCLAHMGDRFPELKGREAEIVGFVWFQGWNEMFPSKGTPFEATIKDYAPVYATMVGDLEKEFRLPRLPSVVAEMGVDGDKPSKEIGELRRRQAEIPAQPSLAGKVRFVPTAGLWDPKLDELTQREHAVRKAAREKVKARVEAELKPTLEGKTDNQRRDLTNQAMDRAVEATGEFKAWNAEWEQVASHWECHYWGSAATYCRIGWAMGEAMKDLLKKETAK